MADEARAIPQRTRVGPQPTRLMDGSHLTRAGGRSYRQPQQFKVKSGASWLSVLIGIRDASARPSSAAAFPGRSPTRRLFAALAVPDEQHAALAASAGGRGMSREQPPFSRTSRRPQAGSRCRTRSVITDSRRIREYRSTRKRARSRGRGAAAAGSGQWRHKNGGGLKPPPLSARRPDEVSGA